MSNENQSVSSPRGEHRFSTYNTFKALLKHLAEDSKEINADMWAVLNDLLTRENFALISAYELYVMTGDREDLIDTLFEIYKIYSDSQMMDDDDDDDDVAKIKKSMEDVIFLFKKKFESKVYDKLADLIRSGDTKTHELHEIYRRDRDEAKFVRELTEYTKEKIKRIEDMKKKMAAQPKKDDRDNWQAELEKFMKVRQSNIPLPDFCGPSDVLAMDPTMSKAIFEVYIRSTKDTNEAIENLCILRNRYVRGSLISPRSH